MLLLSQKNVSVFKTLTNCLEKTCNPVRSVFQTTRPIVQVQERKKIGIVGAPVHHGQKKRGVELGPQALRNAGFAQKLFAMGHVIEDRGDLQFQLTSPDTPIIDNVNNANVVGTANKLISDEVSKCLETNDSCIVLGGDHSIGAGSVAGHARAAKHFRNQDICLLWIDAHADINTPKASHSGSLHGMPVALFLDEMKNEVGHIPGFEWLQPCISARRLCFIGLRDLDPFERSTLEKLNIAAFTMREIDRFGVQECIRAALNIINPQKNHSLHVSWDIDSLDAAVVPATGTPVDGGLTFREALVIAEEIYLNGSPTVLDMVEVNPRIGSEDCVARTVRNAAEIIIAAFRHFQLTALPDQEHNHQMQQKQTKY